MARSNEELRVHEDVDLFREAVSFTAATTGFLPSMIEKDYFCTVVLEDLLSAVPSLVFKGGTCLAKVHAGFFRLSEDLDLAIPMPVDAPRATRSRQAAPARAAIAALPARVPVISVVEPLTGSNSSSQYAAVLAYQSLLSDQHQTIKIEVAPREPFLQPPVNSPAATMLLDPVSAEPLVAPVRLPCITDSEATAEKIRAALTRLDPAIRDFFDLDDIATRREVAVMDPSMLDLVRQKLAIPGNGPVNLSSARIGYLRAQVRTVLAPVLRPQDLERFDLDRAVAIARAVAEALGAAA